MTTKDKHFIEGEFGTSKVSHTADAVDNFWTSKSPSGHSTIHKDEGSAIERARQSSGAK